MQFYFVIILAALFSAVSGTPRRGTKFASDSDSLFQQQQRSGDPESSYSFTYEGITPQNIVTGCQGVKYTDGTSSVEYYVIDSSGNKKAVKPGSSVSITFPANLMLQPVGLTTTVHYRDICFPKQCGSSSCGFVIGPIGLGSSTSLHASSPNLPPSLAFSQFYLNGNFPKNNATAATNASSATTEATASKSSDTEDTQNDLTPDVSKNPKSNLCGARDCAPPPPICAPVSSTVGCPTIVQPPPPQCNCVCNCEKEREPPSRDFSEFVYPSAFSSAGHSKPMGSLKQRSDAAYYASLPGAIRGHTGVIYYPSCERDAYHQVAIIPFCDYRRAGRGLSYNEDVKSKGTGGDGDSSEAVKEQRKVKEKEKAV